MSATLPNDLKARPAWTPARMVLLDIDGLRYDVFQDALQAGRIPNLAGLLGGQRLEKGIQFNAISTLPSITYTCQASTATGSHPRQHWIAGNMFFDRFGRLNNGKPRKYQFDFLDAPAVFMKGLAGEAINPEIDTIYETARRYGRTSTVAFNMYALGATHWLKPGLDDWRLFASVTQKDFGEKYDAYMVQDVLRHLQEGHRPDLLMLYFFGLDHESHLHGPQVQESYLTEVIDRQVGEFLEAYQQLGLMPGTAFCIFSDHGQIAVQNDDLHALKVGFLFDREYGYVFEGLDIDVDDAPLENANCDAILCPNGGMAHVYLRKKGESWQEPPQFDEVQRLAHAFWESNQDGKYSQELKGALSLIALRDVEHEGWYAKYFIYTPEALHPIETFEAMHPELQLQDAGSRLHYLTSPVSGDILLFANYREGYSFSLLPYKGIHGGLHPEDSQAVLAFGFPTASPDQVEALKGALSTAVSQRCRAEGRQPSNADVALGVRLVMGWDG